MTDWLELAIDERNKRYFREQREVWLNKTFNDDCFRSKEDLADRPSICRWALPCATQAEQHEPQRAAIRKMRREIEQAPLIPLSARLLIPRKRRSA